MMRLISAIIVSTLLMVASLKAQERQIEMELISNPSGPLTKNWQFVVDTSPSTRFVFPKLREAFIRLIRQPADEFNFSVITFNLQNMEATKPWVRSSAEEFQAADQFVLTHYGAASYGIKALEMALRQNKDELTVILITDGGFTEVCRNGHNFSIIDDAIDRSQQWRVDNGLAMAIITTIGLENPSYHIGNMPPEKMRQDYLKGLGEKYHGGYAIVRNM